MSERPDASQKIRHDNLVWKSKMSVRPVFDLLCSKERSYLIPVDIVYDQMDGLFFMIRCKLAGESFASFKHISFKFEY